MLHRIRTLYAIERRIRDTPPDQRHRTRQAESVPVLNALRAWLDDTLPKGLPSGPLGKAMRSLDNQWNALVRFCDDGRYGIDTNPVENAIRPFCLGRHNWLFADTVPGANASARLYSNRRIRTAPYRARSTSRPTSVRCRRASTTGRCRRSAGDRRTAPGLAVYDSGADAGGSLHRLALSRRLEAFDVHRGSLPLPLIYELPGAPAP